MKRYNGLTKITAIILTIVIATATIIGVGYTYKSYMKKVATGPEVKTEEPGPEKPIGGEKDEHGCLVAAGYSWCEAKQKCLREWEEPCEQEEAFNLLSELKTATKISFSGINKRELSWQTEDGELTTAGRGFDAVEITAEQYQSIESFFTDQGFKVDPYNVVAGTIAASTGYRLAPSDNAGKGNISCVVTGGVKGYKQATGQWIPPEPNIWEVEVVCATLEIDQTAGWQTYQNEKYAYSVKYPKDCLLGPLPGYCKLSPPEQRLQECRCFLNPTDPDSVMMQTFTGSKSDLSLASLSILRSPNKDYNPPANVDLIEWLKQRYQHMDIPDQFNAEVDGTEAVKVYTPQSRGAYSSEDIFFRHKGELLHIYLIDVDNQDNQELYDKILASIELN